MYERLKIMKKIINAVAINTGAKALLLLRNSYGPGRCTATVCENQCALNMAN
jgi:hypothetical protein